MTIYFTRALSGILEKSNLMMHSGCWDGNAEIMFSEMTGGVVLLCPLVTQGVYERWLIACESVL